MSFGRTLKELAYRAFAPEILIRRRYEAFKALLDGDHESHTLMARLELFYYDYESRTVDFCAVRETYEALAAGLAGMIGRFSVLSPRTGKALFRVLGRADAVARPALASAPRETGPPHVLDLQEPSARETGLAGGKAAHLARLQGESGLPVPRGFVVTSRAFHSFLEARGLRASIDARLAGLDGTSWVALEAASEELRALITAAPLPSGLHETLVAAAERFFPEQRCAVRSSAVGEDETVSFAGQYLTLLNVSPHHIVQAYKDVIAGKYSPTALAYRIRNGLLDEETPMAVLVTAMVDAEASGILYTRDAVSHRPGVLTLHSTWGVGELLVSGEVTPDRIEIARDDLRILDRVKGTALSKASAAPGGGIEITPTDERERVEHTLGDDEARRLASWGVRLEALFGEPQDVEWCRDRHGGLFILQSRPLRSPAAPADGGPPPGSDSDGSDQGRHEEAKALPVLLSGGERASPGVGAGTVYVAMIPADLKEVPHGAVLVAPAPLPALAGILDRLRAVVTDVGSVAGHFATIAREAGVPVLVSTRSATTVLQTGTTVTVDADRGLVLAGVAIDRLRAAADRLQSVEDRGRERQESPFRKRLRALLDRVSPLNLTDPHDESFSPEGCRTLHDILRFTHQKALEAMFSLGAGRRSLRGAVKLAGGVPVQLYVLDLGGGIRSGASLGKTLDPADVVGAPFRAVWKGFSHGAVESWSSRPPPMDWDALERIQEGGGIVGADSPLLASFALVSQDYLNMNLRFGFHFTVVDALCRFLGGDNHISFRFQGGGGQFEGRCLRAHFLARVLEGHGFEARVEGDVLDARVQGLSFDDASEKLTLAGLLLAFTPLLDMRLEEVSQVDGLLEDFHAQWRETSRSVETAAPPSESASTGTPEQAAPTRLYIPTWITENLAVGHAPMSYEELESLRKGGVSAIVNLCGEYCDLHVIEKECGFEVFYLPVRDDEAPEMDALEKALAWLDEAVYLGKKVLVHCRLGVGRTGTFVMSYLMRRGFGLDLAEEKLKKIRSHPSSFTQWRFLRRYGKQAGGLTIREPSLENACPVDLRLYFGEYENLCEEADRAFDAAAARLPGLASCGGETDACCGAFLHLQLIEAVYLRHHLDRLLSREDRLAAIQRAVAAGKAAKGGGASEALYRCPLSVDGRCIAYAHRPVACRVYGMPLNRCAGGDVCGSDTVGGGDAPGGMDGFPMVRANEEMYDISRRLFFALNGSFLEERSLLFPMTHVISGKFLEDYFEVLFRITKGRPAPLSCPLPSIAIRQG